MDYPSGQNHFQSGHAALLLGSYRHWFGKDLLAESAESAKALFHTPIAVISHNTALDPVFNYANLQALALFDVAWGEFTCMPSRFAAEQAERQGRSKLLAEVAAQGCVYPFQGVRVSKNGQRFQVHDGAVWNLFDTDGGYRGQAACFFSWERL